MNYNTYLASHRNILCSKHGCVRGWFISISFNLHPTCTRIKENVRFSKKIQNWNFYESCRTSNANKSFSSREIGDVLKLKSSIKVSKRLLSNHQQTKNYYFSSYDEGIIERGKDMSNSKYVLSITNGRSEGDIFFLGLSVLPLRLR